MIQRDLWKILIFSIIFFIFFLDYSLQFLLYLLSFIASIRKRKHINKINI